MKNLFIAGNWKSNKTLSESEDWIQKVSIKYQACLPARQVSSIKENFTVVICAPYTLLFFLREQIKKLRLPLLLGAQDISPFGEGAYTGEVTGKMIKEVADWVIVGHSERRKYFSETDEMLGKKVGVAKAAGLKIIYCVQDENTVVPDGVDVVAYEPVWAIGTGKTDSPENAHSVVRAIKQKTGAATVIYGGSVTADNVASFVSEQSIDGVLPGGASLDAEKFVKLISQAGAW